jgi:hypothetical protein
VSTTQQWRARGRTLLYLVTPALSFAFAVRMTSPFKLVLHRMDHGWMLLCAQGVVSKS